LLTFLPLEKISSGFYPLGQVSDVTPGPRKVFLLSADRVQTILPLKFLHFRLLPFISSGSALSLFLVFSLVPPPPILFPGFSYSCFQLFAVAAVPKLDRRQYSNSPPGFFFWFFSPSLTPPFFSFQLFFHYFLRRTIPPQLFFSQLCFFFFLVGVSSPLFPLPLFFLFKGGRSMRPPVLCNPMLAVLPPYSSPFFFF